jgi:hypothetical protein
MINSEKPRRQPGEPHATKLGWPAALGEPRTLDKLFVLPSCRVGEMYGIYS